MHELDMIDKIYTRIAEEAKKNGLGAVKQAHLRVGRMNGLERQHFDAALAAHGNDALAGMKLAIEEVPVRLMCNNCSTIFCDERFDDPHFAHATSHAPDLYMAPPCPSCRKEDAAITAGKEMVLVSIEGD